MYLKGKMVSRSTRKASCQGSALYYKPEFPESVYWGRVVIINTLTTLDEVFHARTAKALIAERGLFTSEGAVLARLLKVSVVVLEAARAILRENMWLQIEDHGGISVSLRDYQHDKHGAQFRPHAVGAWILFRPRRHSMLRASMAREAVRNAGAVLWNSRLPVEYREDDHGYWYKNFLLPGQLLDKAQQSPSWVKKMLQDRRRVIASVQQYVKKVNLALQKKKTNNINVKELFALGRQVFIKMRPYTDFTNYVMDEELYRFEMFLKKDCLLEQVAMAKSVATHSRYFEELVAHGIVPPRRQHDFIFPVEMLCPVFLPPVYLKMRFDKMPPILDVMYQLQSPLKRAECLKHLQWTALVSDLSEESDYTYRLLANAFNCVLQEAVKLLQKQKVIRHPTEILDMSIEELGQAIYSLSGKVKQS